MHSRALFTFVLISEIHRMDAENDLFGMEHSRLSFFMTDLWVENESEKASCISYSKSNTHCIGKPAHCKYVMYSGKPPSSWGWVTAIIMATQWNVRQVLCAGRVATQTICYQFQVTSIQILKQKCNIIILSIYLLSIIYSITHCPVLKAICTVLVHRTSVYFTQQLDKISCTQKHVTV